MAPAPAITLVNGRYKLWNYVNSDSQIMELGPGVTNVWHIACLCARNDGKVMDLSEKQPRVVVRCA